MTFIIILIALIIERFFHWSHLRHWQWFTRYQYYLNVRIGNWSKPLLLAACVLPPVLVVLAISCLLSTWWYSVPKLLFGILVLVYCLGPNNLWLQIYSCLQTLNKEGTQAAMEQVQKVFGPIQVDSSQTFHQIFTRIIFVAANQRIFAVLFWFALLGPLGAVLYRLVCQCAEGAVVAIKTLASQVQRVLDWAPVRVFSFILALGGHFTKVFTVWKRYAKESTHLNDVMLGECGLAALSVTDQVVDQDATEKEALELLDRVFVMSLVILGVFVLIT